MPRGALPVKLETTSQITFLDFTDMQAARHFLGTQLGLELVYDPGWACVYRAQGQAFVGAVEVAQQRSPRGTLISLTVSDVEAVYARLSGFGLEGMTPIKKVRDIGLTSFFFVGPEGHRFEIQHFDDPALQALF